MCRWSTALPLVLATVAAGCARMPKSSSLLDAPAAADHVALELFFVSMPPGDSAVSQGLWSSVDEQAIDLSVRRRLAANGFVVGRVGGQLPTAVTDLLQVSDDAPMQPVDQPTVIVGTKAPVVHRKLIDVYQIDTPNRIVVTGERERHAKLVVLYRDEEEGGAVRGQTLPNARGSFLTKVLPQPDGRVKLDIVPEIEYGEPRRDFAPGEGGALTMLVAPPRQTYDGLRLAVSLLPGEMLVFGCRSDRPGSLGQQFLTERQSDALNQVVVLMRVLQGKSDDLFHDDPSRAE